MLWSLACLRLAALVYMLIVTPHTHTDSRAIQVMVTSDFSRYSFVNYLFTFDLSRALPFALSNDVCLSLYIRIDWPLSAHVCLVPPPHRNCAALVGCRRRHGGQGQRKK